jgi:hypothetical protein
LEQRVFDMSQSGQLPSPKTGAIFSTGSPGFVDWEGRNADVIGIGPVYLGVDCCRRVTPPEGVAARFAELLMTKIGRGGARA